jgi:hypothetical protein
MCFSNAIKVTCHWGYFIGTKPYPNPADPSHMTTDEIKAFKLWDHKDTVASYLLSQRLPNTTKMRLASCSTTKE